MVPIGRPSAASCRGITSLSRRGVFIEAVRRLAGHSNLAVTQRYMHATATNLKEAMSKLKK
jgi:site-specific recombinase XerD